MRYLSKSKLRKTYINWVPWEREVWRPVGESLAMFGSQNDVASSGTFEQPDPVRRIKEFSPTKIKLFKFMSWVATIFTSFKLQNFVIYVPLERANKGRVSRGVRNSKESRTLARESILESQIRIKNHWKWRQNSKMIQEDITIKLLRQYQLVIWF